MAETTAVRPTRPAFWRDVRVLRILGQIAFILVALLIFRELVLNLTFHLRRQGLNVSLDFLNSRAGFGIAEGIGYSANQSFRKAYVVGVVNTIRVAGAGIVLATVLGVIMGVARLSPNWLVRKIAQVYVEAIRNTPVLIQIIFWAFAVLRAFPRIQEAVHLDGVAILSNRAVAVVWPRTGEGAGMWGVFLVAGGAVGWLAWRWRTARNERTGEPHHRVLWSLGAFLLVASVGYVLAGSPLRLDAPEVVGRRLSGGVQLSPAYAALLAGLVIYTGAFIAEIVRGSILAVPRGQKEAAEALGLTPFQQLRFVVLPQAMRIAIPPVNSQYLNLTKNSSLGLAIAFPEVMAVSRTIINQSARATEMLVIVMLTYLAMSLFISLVMNVINRAVTIKGERS